MIELHPVTPELLHAALEHGWLEDPETNRLLGFGSGPGGIDRATQDFLQHSQNGMATVVADDAIVGWIATTDDGDESVRLDLFIDPSYRGHGVGTEVVTRAVEAAFAKGARRVGALVPKVNPRARHFFYRHCGFGLEGWRWVAARIDGDLYDVAMYVVTEPAWEKHLKRQEGVDGGD